MEDKRKEEIEQKNESSKRLLRSNKILRRRNHENIRVVRIYGETLVLRNMGKTSWGKRKS